MNLIKDITVSLLLTTLVTVIGLAAGSALSAYKRESASTCGGAQLSKAGGVPLEGADCHSWPKRVWL